MEDLKWLSSFGAKSALTFGFLETQFLMVIKYILIVRIIIVVLFYECQMGVCKEMVLMRYSNIRIGQFFYV